MVATHMEELFLRAYDDYADAIFRHCFFRVRDREVAKDLTQDTFLRTWRALGRGVKIDNIRAFLYRVALNLVIDYSQKKKMLSLDTLAEDGFEPGLDNSEKLQNFLDGSRALERLEEIGPKYRDAVYLRYVEELSPQEIADILGENENTISVRIHRGVEKLRELLES